MDRHPELHRRLVAACYTNRVALRVRWTLGIRLCFCLYLSIYLSVSVCVRMCVCVSLSLFLSFSLFDVDLTRLVPASSWPELKADISVAPGP